MIVSVWKSTEKELQEEEKTGIKNVDGVDVPTTKKEKTMQTLSDVLHQESLAFSDTTHIWILKNKTYKVSVFIGIYLFRIYVLVCKLHTVAGPNFIRIDVWI